MGPHTMHHASSTLATALETESGENVTIQYLLIEAYSTYVVLLGKPQTLRLITLSSQRVLEEVAHCFHVHVLRLLYLLPTASLD